MNFLRIAITGYYFYYIQLKTSYGNSQKVHFPS